MSRLWVVLCFLIFADTALAQQRNLGAVATDNAATFRGQPGRRVTYVCPARIPLTGSGSVWGTDVYTDDSPLCLSAIHAGALQAGRAGAVTLVVGGRVASFQGSTRNGVTSQAYTDYPSSMTFDKSGEPGDIDWSTTGKSIPPEIRDPIVVNCPPRGVPSNAIWGTDVYADDSSICVAAVHAGVITLAAGGRVGVTGAPGAASYTASARNGVTSQGYGAWDVSFRVAAAGTTSAAPAGAGVTGIVIRVTAVGVSTVSWDAVPGAQSYVVVRWKSDDTTCCNNLSPPGAQAAATSWVDSVLLPKNGTYGYRVYAHTSTGIVAGEATIAWNGAETATPVLTQTRGGGAPVAEAAPTATRGATPVVIAPATATATANAPVGVVGTLAPPAAPPAALPANAGRYRVVLTGALVAATTKDSRDDGDGKGDEITSEVFVMQWDRRTNAAQPRTLARTREYGDVNAIRKDADRIKAGNAGEGGGLKAGNSVPDRFALGVAPGTPSKDTFPLLVWEGVLTDGVDGLLVVPSIWERDVARRAIEAYEFGWLSGNPTSTVEIANLQVPLPTIVAAQSTVHPGFATLLTLTDLAAQLIDRPLGLTPTPLIAPFNDRFIVITREKLKALTAAGSATTVLSRYFETADDPILGADYTLELRIERLQ